MENGEGGVLAGEGGVRRGDRVSIAYCFRCGRLQSTVLEACMCSADWAGLH
jgi:hypothetical protein